MFLKSLDQLDIKNYLDFIASLHIAKNIWEAIKVREKSMSSLLRIDYWPHQCNLYLVAFKYTYKRNTLQYYKIQYNTVLFRNNMFTPRFIDYSTCTPYAKLILCTRYTLYGKVRSTRDYAFSSEYLGVNSFLDEIQQTLPWMKRKRISAIANGILGPGLQKGTHSQ